MPNKRKICVFSGKRGGFGAYVPLMQLIAADPDLELQILLGDMHASKEFGNTIEEVRKFFPKSTIEILEMGAGRGDSPKIRAENLGIAMQKAPAILEKLAPDLVMVHGDRGEHLMVAYAALNLGLAVSHSQGGEVSGNIDDVQRHTISKICHIHFPETVTAADRLKRLGEEEWRIHIVGSIYIDRIVRKMYTDPATARIKYGLNPTEDFLLLIFHPDTFLSREENYQAAKNLLTAIQATGQKVIATHPCSDPGYEEVLKALDEVKNNPRFSIYKNIENLDFLSLMSQAKALVGNSSSALVEAPYFQLPAVNIGRRQEGRDREGNVLDAQPIVTEISAKIDYVLGNTDFQAKLAKCGHRLGDGRTSERILQIIKTIPINEKLLRKRFS